MTAEPAGGVRLAYVTTRSDQVQKLQRYAGKSQVARWFPTFAYFSIVALAWLSAVLFYARQGEKNYLYVLSGLLALLLTIGLPALSPLSGKLSGFGSDGGQSARAGRHKGVDCQ